MTLKQYKTFALESLLKHYESREAESICMRLFEDKYGIKREDFIINGDKIYNLGRGFYSAIEKLCSFTPIQHITGFQEFMGLRFHVTSSTLIPRPETEELVSLIVDREHRKEGLRILDIGTGSGAIAISLAKYIKGSIVTGIDISKRALNIAIKNAETIGVKNISFEKLDFINGKKPEGFWDIIVSNPPYIPEEEMTKMPKNVIGHDPGKALFVKKPLIFYSEISRYAYSHLVENGRLYFEINENFGQATLDEVRKQGFNHSHLLKDMFGKDRFIWSEK